MGMGDFTDACRRDADAQITGRHYPVGAGSRRRRREAPRRMPGSGASGDAPSIGVEFWPVRGTDITCTRSQEGIACLAPRHGLPDQ